MSLLDTTALDSKRAVRHYLDALIAGDDAAIRGSHVLRPCDSETVVLGSPDSDRGRWIWCSLCGLRIPYSAAIRPPRTSMRVSRWSWSPQVSHSAGWPLASTSPFCGAPGWGAAGKRRATPMLKAATLSRPRIGRSAALTRPPPSVQAVASSVSIVVRVARSPRAAASTNPVSSRACSSEEGWKRSRVVARCPGAVMPLTAARGRGPDDLGDVGVGDAERLSQHEHRTFRGREAFHEVQRRVGQRVAEFGGGEGARVEGDRFG